MIRRRGVGERAPLAKQLMSIGLAYNVQSTHHKNYKHSRKLAGLAQRLDWP
jgi:hypothetical protein